ncbi:hypothetical protein FisN_18Lh035 [Fistulifera solaris]|uniref:Proline-rich protein PRCC n=1 Tax=Fistulifera solaris TaxID=1519565 RepID=A0A1Z5K1H5_FISSO|nr:hypothetical protein FisN_18Lh035 [Fistulifera solaris]|eukprot:GAX20097.1 hypothetical protein FisN_18Lh035 [Fistulifera solaris]
MDLLDDASSTSSSVEKVEEKEVIDGRKARKLLSLAAVLSQSILDELTQQRGNDDSSDDDERPQSKRRPVSKDGISNFLAELQAVRPGNYSLPSNSKAKGTTDLGTAFLQTSTVIQKGNTVRNIHQEESTSTSNGETELPIRAPHVVKRLSTIRPVIQAAPTIAPESTVRPVVSIAPAVAMESMVAAVPESSAESVTEPHHTESTQTNDDTNRKRSRRDMEKALRKGDFQTLQVTHYVEQANPDAYVPDPETYAVPQHGIKVVPTAMYDPKAGTATNLAAGKGRGKNQIHHLMASAANLELQRARGMAGTSNASSHRANAKQKYGW